MTSPQPDTPTTAKKPTPSEMVFAFSGSHPDAFTTPRERMLWEADFKFLVQTFVTEKNPAIWPGEFNKIKQDRIRDLLTHDGVKNFDVKAKAAGGKITLVLAKECSGMWNMDEVNEDAFKTLASFNPTPAQLEEVARDGLLRLAGLKKR